uniref:Uncharacterized protein n=1 Tax=Parascaris univalens TaxID=6257 RepID=A0A914ZZ19_PARUN
MVQPIRFSQQLNKEIFGILTIVMQVTSDNSEEPVEENVYEFVPLPGYSSRTPKSLCPMINLAQVSHLMPTVFELSRFSSLFHCVISFFRRRLEADFVCYQLADFYLVQNEDQCSFWLLLAEQSAFFVECLLGPACCRRFTEVTHLVCVNVCLRYVFLHFEECIGLQK